MLRPQPETFAARYIFLGPDFEYQHDGWVNVYPWGYACINPTRIKGDSNPRPIYRIRVKWKEGYRNGQ